MNHTMRCAIRLLDDCLINEQGQKICALSEVITRCNRRSAHHIEARRNGGKSTKGNVIPLSDISHHVFNIIERRKPNYSDTINEGFVALLEKENERAIVIRQLKIFSSWAESECDYDRYEDLYVLKKSIYVPKK